MTFAARTLADSGTGSGGGPPPSTYVPVTQTFTGLGTYTATIPTPAPGDPGPTSLTVELGGPGGGGAFSPYMTRSPQGVSGSGGSGGLCRSVFPLTSADYGHTFTVLLNNGGAGGDPVNSFTGATAYGCQILNGSFATSVNMMAAGGGGGTFTPGQSGGSSGGATGGAGGVASGGNQANLSGNQGQGDLLYSSIASNPNAPRGGAGVQGRIISSGAGGNSSSIANGLGNVGGTGTAAFAYT